jgi:hypothetical protein
MIIFKRILLILLLTTLFIAGAFYLYIQSLPTAPPDFVNISDLNNKIATPFNCTNKADFKYAYQVQVNIESVLNDKTVYQSELTFNTQLSQANDKIIKGIANDILIDEGQGAVNIKDVYYLSRVEAQPFALFTAFNDLGLVEKHPMKILAQLFKALSVGGEGKKYHFAYDSMQRTYSYHHNNNIVTRNASATTANINQLTSSLQSLSGNNNWQVTLGNDCMPATLHSQERKGLSAAGHQGYIKFTINAKKITPYTDLSSVAINQSSNSHNLWRIKTIASSEFEQAVTSDRELWSIMTNFENEKNTAKLIKAAEYLIENITPDDLAAKLMAAELADNTKRDLAFALSLSGHNNAEGYLVDTLLNLSTNASKGEMASDLQKVRLMVALSGNGQVSELGFQALASLAENTNESNNVRNNALINLGSTLQQLKVQDHDSAGLAEQLASSLSQAIEGENSSSAILAAGNAKLETLDSQIMLKLNSSNSKERYAAASVLARNSDYNDNLIKHLANETSDLVNYAILTNLDPLSLSNQQKDELRNISTYTSTDITQVISQLIKY